MKNRMNSRIFKVQMEIESVEKIFYGLAIERIGPMPLFDTLWFLSLEGLLICKNKRNIELKR